MAMAMLRPPRRPRVARSSSHPTSQVSLNMLRVYQAMGVDPDSKEGAAQEERIAAALVVTFVTGVSQSVSESIGRPPGPSRRRKMRCVAMVECPAGPRSTSLAHPSHLKHHSDNITHAPARPPSSSCSPWASSGWASSPSTYPTQS
jgi:hypothetical protein